ncbi:MAG TPA: hypothetical protein VGK50_06370 [Coriobacteriia bacterium]|jgi:hypothetical protein
MKRNPAASGSTPTYWECPECDGLLEDPSSAEGRKACPFCGGTSGNPRRTFPTDRLRRLDNRIRAYHAEGENEIVVILVAAFLEAILEDIIDRILVSHGADLPVRRAVLDSNRAIGTRIAKLFPQLTGHEFEDVAAELGFRDFPHRWREMREARNDFIHDSPFHGPRETLDGPMAAQAMLLLDQAYLLFVDMNNRFVVDGHRRERA